MGLFSKPKQSEEELKQSLVEIAAFGASDESAYTKSNMDKVLAKVESQVNEATSSMVLYWLGIAWRNYTSWHVRGDERKPYLEKSVAYYQRAFDRSKEEWPLRQPYENRHDGDFLDQISIASDLGSLLIDELIIRDLDRGERILQFVFNGTDEYEPCLCSYAELFYKRGMYEKAAEVALQVHERAVKSAKAEWEYIRDSSNNEELDHWDGLKQAYVKASDYDWHNLIAPASLGIAGKAMRTLAKQSKKDGDIVGAKKWFTKLIDLGVATDNDKKIYSKL